MGLSQKLVGDFTNAVRNHGRDYYGWGRVRILRGSSREVYARVQGSRGYEVRLLWEDGLLYGSCDCEDYSFKPPCKHLWATVLAADAWGYLRGVSGLYVILECVDPWDLGIAAAPKPPHPPLPPPPPPWKSRLTDIVKRAVPAIRIDEWPAKRELLYVVSLPGSLSAGGISLGLAVRDRKPNGGYSRAVPLVLTRDRIAHLPLTEDREIVAALAGCVQYSGWGYLNPSTPVPASYIVAHPLGAAIMPLAARTGRCYAKHAESQEELLPLVWDDGGPWEFALEMRAAEKGWTLDGVLRRGTQPQERLALADAALINEGGLLFTPGRMAPLAEGTPFQWIAQLRTAGSIEVAEKDTDEMLATLLSSPNLPALEIPEELHCVEVNVQPRPRLHIRAAEKSVQVVPKLRADLFFDYEGLVVSAEKRNGGLYDAAARRLVRRNFEMENAAAGLLSEVGLRFRQHVNQDYSPHWDLAAGRLPRVVRVLVEAGWHIDADGKIFRRPGSFKIHVATGVNWFELHGDVEYGDTSAKLPALLEALRRGENMVRLDDGTYGVVPEEWLKRIGMLAGAGAAEDGHIRFRRSQAGLLDALLATQPEACCDEAFTRIREELSTFQGIEAAAQPAGFAGCLRDYQREGLGWMGFLRRFSFGGCLADDMGVGKTAQVLALLETRRELRAAGGSAGPSLVVVPRSLIFNWRQEAERFTPRLRLLDYSGSGRNGDDFSAYDIILATYGTLRRDVVHLKDVEFDYIVLDEAQAVKNANTESAKAVRLLRGEHRLVLSGTPVENHLGELWSLFEFLNPGMLGAANVFKLAGAAARNPDEDTRRLLAHALRPFILRRTKDQVARELPSKTEQTVYCEMDPPQRKVYNELRHHYRDRLLKRIETEGLAKSKIQVLEALLRLRQAACHPGLIDPKRQAEGSAKLEVLLEQLREVIDEGHKALVFSQFTSLLAIVRNRLDAGGVPYEYLDGQTRDRQAHVERFQTDADCRLFLISLKAGGLGLNLTAAEYVFLLDPWWNPAVEAQAVDRAHRIGQTRQVFAYRLIARDTVEEKVLELQKSKRDLAAAIIGEDNSLIRDLGREDLELLLS